MTFPKASTKKRSIYLLLVALIVMIGAITISAGDQVERVYHYVGREKAYSGSDLITLLNFNENADAKVRLEVVDHRGTTRFQFNVPRKSHLDIRTADLGIIDLYYVRIRSDRRIAASIIETYFETAKDEMGGVTPQEQLYSEYALANASSGGGADDFFRVYAPTTPTTIEFYDQNMNLLATRTISGNGLAEFKGSDLGYGAGWSAYIKAANSTPNPFAISFQEGPGIAFLIIPQGIR
ncbi:MAG: hypothetical protein GY943_21650 [Chloroflexi bacterium]|nr:hypothetical protein [Chloroflexota bacterium]